MPVFQVIDALNSDDIEDEIAQAALMFVVIGCISLVTSIGEMGLMIWSGVPLLPPSITTFK